jgi:dTDP-4-amino-4,6-dideoxygalactose transaminase
MLNNSNIAPWPFFESDEIAAASATLSSGKTNYWTGELGKQFEQAYRQFVGQPYGIALSNGTVALELALRVLGVQAGDEVIVASRSYVASASCVLLLGAIPVFADVDIHSGNITPETIAPLITIKTKAIIPVHVGGWPCNMPTIMALAKQYNLRVIEDCAQAHGAMVAGKYVGSFGDAAIFSFCQDKIISTGGEGGMLLLNDEVAYKKAWAYKDIGRSYDAVYNQQHPPGFRWMTESAGSNFRITEFQAAIGLKQLEKLPVWIARRNEIADELLKSLMTFDFIGVNKFQNYDNSVHARYRLYVYIKQDVVVNDLQNEMLRDTVISTLNEAGVPCFVGSCAEIYREKLFANMQSIPTKRLQNAKFYAENAFCLLTHHTITNKQLKQLAAAIQSALSSLIYQSKN